jgi:hypothetical protein
MQEVAGSLELDSVLQSRRGLETQRHRQERRRGSQHASVTEYRYLCVTLKKLIEDVFLL